MPSLIRTVVVNYNGFADTIECLQSLKEQIGVDCNPLVIDNASHNDSVVRIKAAHPDVELLESRLNLGFAGGNNVGIEHALAQGCDYLFLVNNDTAMEPDCLQNLLHCTQQHPDAAVVVPAMYYYSNKAVPWFTGSTASMESGIFSHEERDVVAEGIKVPFAVPWVTGCAMLVSASRMREVGGFDTQYFCYYEDVDWSLRAKRMHAVCMLCPQAVLYHKVFGSSTKKSTKIYYYAARNRLLCMAKNIAPDKQRPLVRRRALHIIREAKQMLMHPQAGAGRRRAVAELLGVADFHLNRFGACPYPWL